MISNFHKKNFILLLSIIFLISCKNTDKKIEFKKDSKEKLANEKEEQNSDMFYIIKLDSIKNVYVIYAKKAEVYYKIVSEKSNTPIQLCEKVKLFRNYDFDLASIVPDTSKISLHLDGILYRDAEVVFEKDSIWDLYESPQLMGYAI